MANVKFSAITASGTNLSNSTDVLMGVRSGTTDLTWTPAQAAAYFWASPAWTGSPSLAGSGSGVITLTAQAAAGTYNFNLPITSGNSGDVLTSGGGGSTAMSWVTPIAINNLTDTWNNIATTFTAIKMNVTDTNSAAASLLLDLQIGSATKFNVRKDGTATAVVAVLTPSLTLGTVSSATGTLNLANSASANLTTIQAGNAAAARTYTWPTNFGAAGTVLTDAAGDGTLSWAAAGGSTAYTLTMSGNKSATAWTTTGIGLVGAAASFTDTSSSGTVAAMYVNRLGIPTILASSATVYTKAYGLWVEPPTASTNVTITNKYAAGFNANIYVNGSLTIDDGAGGSPATWSVLSSNRLRTSNAVLVNNAVSANEFKVDDSNGDCHLTRGGVATWQLGIADSSAPVAQGIKVQSVSAGNTNTAGVDFTFTGSLSNGSGAGGKIIFKSSLASAGSGTQNTAAASITITNSSATGIAFNGYGAGALSTDASGNITATSDEQAKDIQGSFTSGLAEIMQINPIRYRWKEGSGMETKHEYAGFGAHNVNSAIPLATGMTPDGLLTLQDRALLAACVNAIKELASRA